MYRTTVTITRDDILQGEDWVLDKVRHLVPGVTDGVPEFDPGSDYFRNGDLHLTVLSLSPDGATAVVIFYNNEGDGRSECPVVDLVDAYLRGEFS